MFKKMMLCALFFSGSALAAMGDQTLSVGFSQTGFDGLKKTHYMTSGYIKSMAVAEAQAFGAPFNVSSDGYKDPQGLFMRYRYEFDDRWGIMASATYSLYDGTTRYSGRKEIVRDDVYTIDSKGRLKGDYASLMAGPSFRANEYISLYILGGAAFHNIKYEYDRKYRHNGVDTFSEKHDMSKSNTSAAWSVGTQINAYKGLVLDAAWEGSAGGSDWKTSGFTVGLGYRW